MGPALASYVAAMALSIAHPSAPSAGVPADPAGFTAHVAAHVRQVTSVPVTVAAPLALDVAGRKADLQALYDACWTRAAPCEQQVAAYAAGTADALRSQDAPLSRAAVRVVVRSGEYLAKARAAAGADAAALPARALATGLYELAVLDTPRAVRTLSARDLAALGLSEEEAFALGRANTAAALPPLSQVAQPAGQGEVGSVGGSLFEVGRVALHAQWSALAAAQHGELVIAMPTTDLVLYVSDTSPDTIESLRDLAGTVAAQSPNPLAPRELLRWSASGWQSVGPSRTR